MSINRDIENDWEWFRNGAGSMQDGDYIIVVRDGEAIRMGLLTSMTSGMC